jgi:MFS family permease
MTVPSGHAFKGTGRVDYGWTIVGASSLVMLASFGLLVTYGLFLNPLIDQFGWSRAAVSGAYSLSSIVAGGTGIVAGVLTDRLGARIVVTVSGLLLGVGYALMFHVHNLAELYIYYGLLVGTGMSGMWVPPLSTVARWFDKRRTLVTGVVLSGMTIGQVIVPPIVSRMIGTYGWRTTYLILGLVALVIIVLAAQLLRREPTHTSRPGEGGETAAHAPAAGLTLGEAARTRQFWMIGGTFFFCGMSAFGLLIHFAPRVISVGLSEIDAANVLAVTGAVGIPGSFLLGGLLGHWIGDRKAFILGLTLVLAGMLLVVPARSLWALYLCAVIFGTGMSGMATAESPLVASLFGLANHGSIYSACGIGYTVGGALGPLLFGGIFDATGSYDLALFLGGGFAVVALALLLLLRPLPKAGPQQA